METRVVGRELQRPVEVCEREVEVEDLRARASAAGARGQVVGRKGQRAGVAANRVLVLARDETQVAEKSELRVSVGIVGHGLGQVLDLTEVFEGFVSAATLGCS